MWTQQKISTVGEAVIVAETGQLGTLGQLIKQGLGIAIMPSLCIASMESIALTVLKMEEDPLVKKGGHGEKRQA